MFLRTLSQKHTYINNTMHEEEDIHGLPESLIVSLLPTESQMNPIPVGGKSMEEISMRIVKAKTIVVNIL